MTNEEIADWFIEKAKKEMDENNLEDAEVTLIEARFKCKSDRVASLLREVQDKKALLNIEMNVNTRNTTNENSENREPNSLKEPTMSEKTDTMMRNMFLMRYAILSMQLKVAAVRIEALKAKGSGSVCTTDIDETERYRKKARREFSNSNIGEANSNLTTAEQMYLKIAEKLFPAKPKKDEKPSNEYLRMKKPVAVSNRPGVTVRGAQEDVQACLKKARIAFAANELEKAKKWLDKSERMMPTTNARGLLNEVLAAIAERDASKKVPNVDPEVSTDTVADPNSTVDSNVEDVSDQTNSETIISTEVTDNIIGANTFLDKAENAYFAGEFEKSQHYLLKAQRMNSNLDINSKLKQVKDAIDNRNKTSRENPVSDSTKEEPLTVHKNNLNKDEADTYIQIAMNAFNDKNYERALIFLNKADEVYPSNSAKCVRKLVLDAKTKQEPIVSTRKSCLSSDEPKESFKDKLDKLKQAIKTDIAAGNLEEAEKKLQSPGFVCCTQLKTLRSEVNYLKTKKELQRQQQQQIATTSSSTKEQKQPKPTETVSTPIEKLSDIHKEEAETCIEIADKAYYDGDLIKAERLLKKAERLYSSERARDILEKVKISLEERRQASENAITTETVGNQAPVERTPETHFDDEVQTLINSGFNYMRDKCYYSAKILFEKAYDKYPCKFIDDLVKNCKSINKEKNESGSRRTEGTSTRTENAQTCESKNKIISDKIIAEAEMNTNYAEYLYKNNDNKNAEYFVKLADAYSTMRSRRLLVNILQTKHSYDVDSDDSDADGFVKVQSKKKGNAKKKYAGKGYVTLAEESFVSGEFKEARNYLSMSQVYKCPYVKELKENIDSMVKRSANGLMDKFKNFCYNMNPLNYIS